MTEFSSETPHDFPNLDLSLFDVPTAEKLAKGAEPEIGRAHV